MKSLRAQRKVPVQQRLVVIESRSPIQRTNGINIQQSLVIYEIRQLHLKQYNFLSVVSI